MYLYTLSRSLTLDMERGVVFAIRYCFSHCASEKRAKVKARSGPSRRAMYRRRDDASKRLRAMSSRKSLYEYL